MNKGRGWESTTKGHQKIWGADRTISYLNCDMFGNIYRYADLKRSTCTVYKEYLNIKQ